MQEEIDYIQPVAENLFQAAYAFYQSGRLEDALPLLQQVVRLNPNHQRGTQLLAEILLAQNRLDEARQLLENLYQSSPAVARPRLIQTLLLQAQANVPEDKQLELYERVLALEPGRPEALAGQRRIWEQRGDKARAEGDIQTALEAYGRQSRTQDKFLEASLLYIANLERAEKFETALEQAKVLWKAFPKEKARLPDLDLLQRKTQLSGLYSQGLTALEADRKDEATKFLVQVVGLSSSYREATRFLHQAVTGEDIDALRTKRDQTASRPNTSQLAPGSAKQEAPVQRHVNGQASTASAAAPSPDAVRLRPLSQQRLQDHFQVLGWTFFAPARLRLYFLRSQGRSVLLVGRWLVIALMWLPLLLVYLGTGFGTLPREASGIPAAVYFLVGGAAAIAPLLAAWEVEGDTKRWIWEGMSLLLVLCASVFIGLTSSYRIEIAVSIVMAVLLLGVVGSNLGSTKKNSRGELTTSEICDYADLMLLCVAAGVGGALIGNLGGRYCDQMGCLGGSCDSGRHRNRHLGRRHFCSNRSRLDALLPASKA